MQATGPALRNAVVRQRVRGWSARRRAWLTGVILAEVGVFYLVLRNGGWVFDDNLSLELARAQGLSWQWLGANLFGHWEVAHRAIFSLQLHLMPLDYRWALLAMLALLAVSMHLLGRITFLITESLTGSLVVVAVFGISVLLVAPMQWWSTGLEAFPTIACDLLCVWAYLRYREAGATRWIMVSAGALAAGLLFYEKPAYVPLYLLLLRVLVLGEERGVRSVVRGLWREKWIWASYIAVLVTYLVVREATGAGSIASSGPASLSQWLSFLRVFWVESLVPSLFGLRMPANGLTTLQVVAVVTLQVVVIGTVVATVIRRRAAWYPWLALGIAVAANAALIGEGRLAGFGPGVADDPRYLFDFAWLAPLLVGLAVTRPTGGMRMSAPAPNPPRFRAGRWLPAIRSIALAVYFFASITTAVTMQSQWQGEQARRWEQNLERSLSRLTAGNRTPIVANAVTPWYIVEAAFAPYNELSNVLPLYGPIVQVDGPLDGRVYIVDGSGHLVPATLGKPLAAFPGPRSACQAGGGQPAVVRFSLPTTLSPQNVPYYALLSYTTQRDVTVPVFVDSGGGFSPDPSDVVYALARQHEAIGWLGPGTPRGLMLDVPSGQGVCLHTIDIVTLKASVTP